MKWSDLTLKERKQIYDAVRAENPNASYFDIKSQFDLIPEYEDGGIHIKKKNKGKFNALKKRTGKSTEELTHSKNPLTRKRAIFAQNAAKWNKGKKKK